MTENEAAIAAFAAEFAPELTWTQTERINDIAIPDAWVCSHWDAERRIGVSAFAYGGQFKAYIEAAGPASIAEAAGQVLAKAMGMLAGPAPRTPTCCPHCGENIDALDDNGIHRCTVPTAAPGGHTKIGYVSTSRGAIVEIHQAVNAIEVSDG